MPVLSYISQENALKMAEVISRFTLDSTGGFRFSETDDQELDELINAYAGDGASLRDIFDTATNALSSLATIDRKYQNFLESGEKIFDYINRGYYLRSPIQEKSAETKIGQRIIRDQALAAIDFALATSMTNDDVRDAIILYSMYPGKSGAQIKNRGFQNAVTILEHMKAGSMNCQDIYPHLEKQQHSLQDLIDRMKRLNKDLESRESLLLKELYDLGFKLRSQPIPSDYSKDYQKFFHNLFNDVNGKTNFSDFEKLLTNDTMKMEFSKFLNSIPEDICYTYEESFKGLSKHLSSILSKDANHPRLFEGIILNSAVLAEEENNQEFPEKDYTVLMRNMVKLGMKINPNLSTNPLMTELVNNIPAHAKATASELATPASTGLTRVNYSLVQEYSKKLADLKIERAEQIAKNTGVVQANRTHDKLSTANQKPNSAFYSAKSVAQKLIEAFSINPTNKLLALAAASTDHARRITEGRDAAAEGSRRTNENKGQGRGA